MFQGHSSIRQMCVRCLREMKLHYIPSALANGETITLMNFHLDVRPLLKITSGVSE